LSLYLLLRSVKADRQVFHDSFHDVIKPKAEAIQAALDRTRTTAPPGQEPNPKQDPGFLLAQQRLGSFLDELERKLRNCRAASP